MGKGTISGETGEGLYSLTVDNGSAIAVAEIAKLNSRLADLSGILASIIVENNTAQLDVIVSRNSLNSKINIYVAALNAGGDGKDERISVDDATVVLIDAIAASRVVGLKYDIYKGEESSITKEIARLYGLNLTNNISAWCVTLTEDATGEVATIEIPGEPVTTLIAPEARAHTSSDGIILDRPVQDEKQLFVNLAMLPGWQKFKPTYRVGEVTFIDHETDLCSVSLDSAKSSAQNLNINQFSFLESVPIEYLDCDGDVFEINDRVVVEFTGQEWSGAKVIGFESEPKECHDAKVYRYSETIRTASSSINRSIGVYTKRYTDDLKILFDDSFVGVSAPIDHLGVTDIEVYFKKEGGSWNQSNELNVPFGSVVGYDEWWGSAVVHIYQDPGALREKYSISFVVPWPVFLPRYDPVSMLLGATRRVDPPPTSPKEDIPGIVEFFCRRISTGEVYLHVATDMNSETVAKAGLSSITGYRHTIVSGSTTVPKIIPGYSMSKLEYELSAPPP